MQASTLVLVGTCTHVHSCWLVVCRQVLLCWWAHVYSCWLVVYGHVLLCWWAQIDSLKTINTSRSTNMRTLCYLISIKKITQVLISLTILFLCVVIRTLGSIHLPAPRPLQHPRDFIAPNWRYRRGSHTTPVHSL